MQAPFHHAVPITETKENCRFGDVENLDRQREQIRVLPLRTDHLHIADDLPTICLIAAAPNRMKKPRSVWSGVRCAGVSATPGAVEAT
jgi:hypothetical protein